MAQTPAAPAPKDAPSETDTTIGKGRATPSRAEQEAARTRLGLFRVRNERTLARAEIAAQREKARVGMAAGDDRYLTARDKGPQRRWVRDWVDARWSIGEAVMPAMVLVIIATFVPVYGVQFYSFVALWVFIFFVIGDMILLSNRVKKMAREKWGANTEKGLGWYAAMRTIQMRFLRLPKPQVKRGQKPA